MTNYHFIGLAALLLAGSPVLAAPTPPDTLRPLSPVRELTYAYANDLSFCTDYYFTQGMRLVVVHPALARLPLRHLLVAGRGGSTQQFGVALRYDGFTPLRIQDEFIRYGDRPYAAYLYASFFRHAADPVRARQLATALEIGFIGPAAGGRELQTYVHRVTDNPVPRGWQYQVRNAPVLAYRLRLEQRLAATAPAELTGHAETVLGTLYTQATAGLTLRVGRFAPAFGPVAPHSAPTRWQLYGLAGLEGRAVGYNATLQGSLLSDDDPYTLSSGDVRRLVLRSTGGLVLARERLRLAATTTWLSPEFAGGRTHRWGQLALTVGL